MLSLAISAIIAGTMLSITGFTVTSLVAAQTPTGDNTSMTGNMTDGNITGGNMTGLISSTPMSDKPTCRRFNSPIIFLGSRLFFRSNHNLYAIWIGNHKLILVIRPKPI